MPVNCILSKQEKALFIQSISIVEFNKKETIIKQGSKSNNIIYLQHGLVKISRELRKDKHIIIKLDNDGKFAGLVSLFDSNSINFTVTAIEQSKVVFINIDTFIQVMESNARFATETAKLISYNTIFNINRITGLLHKQLPGRVADLILYFSEQLFNAPQFRIPLTRLELAELCGTTKESLIRTLSEFKHDKIIEMDKKFIKVISYDILKTLSRLG